MNNNQFISLTMMINAIQSLEVFDGDKTPVIESLKKAKEAIIQAAEAMDELQVKGYKSLDTLLACMMVADQMTGMEG